MPPRLTPKASVLSPRDRLGNALPQTGPSRSKEKRVGGRRDGGIEAQAELQTTCSSWVALSTQPSMRIHLIIRCEGEQRRREGGAVDGGADRSTRSRESSRVRGHSPRDEGTHTNEFARASWKSPWGRGAAAHSHDYTSFMSTCVQVQLGTFMPTPGPGPRIAIEGLGV